MGSKPNRKSNPTKARSNTRKQYVVVKQAAKKRHHKWSKNQSERIRDALDRDADLLYNALENPSTASSTIPKMDSVLSLAEGMQSLGR